MEIVQKQSNINDIRRPLLVITPHGLTEQQYCAAMAKELPAEERTPDWPVYGPVDLVICVGDEMIHDQFSLFDRIYLKFNDAECNVIAGVRRREHYNKWIAKIRKKFWKYFNL